MLTIARQVVSSKAPVMTIAASRALSSFQRPFSTSLGDLFHGREKIEEDRYIRKIEHRDMANPQWNGTAPPTPAATVTPEQEAMQEIRHMLNEKDYLTYPTLEALVQWKLKK